MEYIKGGCAEGGEELCNVCLENEWISPPVERIPQPMPSHTNIGHYKDVFNTPTENRVVDDFAPRANLKKLFKKGEISSKQHEAIQEFSTKYAVDPEAVSSYIKHMEQLKRMSEIKSSERAKARAQQQLKTFRDFDWPLLVTGNTLSKLTVVQLRLYLDEKHLSKGGNKHDKIERIKYHYYLSKDLKGNQKEKRKTPPIPVPDYSYDESSDEDEVLI